MGQIDVTDAWLYKYMSIVDEAIIVHQMEHIIHHVEKMHQQQVQYMEYMIWQVEHGNMLWEYIIKQ